MNALQILLAHSIDYAGLFPPAELAMDAALDNYARYVNGPSSWALGRFIVPASRLAELEAGLGRTPGREIGRPWRVAALVGTDVAADLRLLEAFNGRTGAQATIDTIEVKATSERDIDEIARLVPASFQTYIEIPIEADPGSLIAVIGHRGHRAKVRTGGITRNAFPQTADLLRFLRETVRLQVPFKATAGLHHPLRAVYRLTYAEQSPSGIMFGFLNLLLAVAFLQAGMEQTEVAGVLEEGDPGAFQVDDSGISWRGNRLSSTALSAARRLGMNSFGSCSFTEPLADLAALQLLPPTVSLA